METQRLVALMVFLFSSFMLWEAWQRYQNPQLAAPRPGATTSAPATGTGAAVPSAGGSASVPATSTGSVAQSSPAISNAPAAQQGQRVKVTSTAMDVEFDTLGADIRRIQLNKHLAAEDKAKKFLLMKEAAPPPVYFTHSGLIGAGLPNHNTLYTPAQNNLELKPDDAPREISFTAQSDNGVKVKKFYRFRNQSKEGGVRGSEYVIDVGYHVENGSSEAIEPWSYFLLVHDGSGQQMTFLGVNTYTGPAIFNSKDKFQKVPFADIEKALKDPTKRKYSTSATDGWMGLMQHYFVAAWLPQGNIAREFETDKLDNGYYRAGLKLPLGRIEPGKSAELVVPFYAGPQEVAKLKTIAPGLDFTIDYGWLTPLASPLFWVLEKCHALAGNWGVAIILLTVLVKLIFFPLSAASYKSMARMKLLAPRMEKLRQQYGDDRQKMSQAMMEMYKQEKINPLGGCLPILIQIPVFIALYWVLLAAVELRHAPFFGWIQDLSAPDPLYILPVIMAITMFIQTKLNPPPPDPVQAKVMLFMPLVFSIMFFFFASGLVLYWTVNNVLSIAQQWHMMRITERNQNKAGKR